MFALGFLGDSIDNDFSKVQIGCIFRNIMLRTQHFHFLFNSIFHTHFCEINRHHHFVNEKTDFREIFTSKITQLFNSKQ